MAKTFDAEQKTAKRKKPSKFMLWYESYRGKKVVNIFYSAGASVVIIGALFKIMHFPGAGPMLMVGMGVEAFLFLIGVLDKPHPEFHWENVFPQLLEYGTEPELLKEMQSRPHPTLLGAGVAGGEVTTVQQGETQDNHNNGVNVPSLSEKDMDALRDGIGNLAKTAVQLSELSQVATATNRLGEKLDAAGDAAEQFVVAGRNISEKSETLGNTYAQVTANMQNVATETKAYEEKVHTIVGQLSSLNAVYELQLKTIQAQVEAYQTQTEKVTASSAQVDALTANVKKMTDVTSETLKSQEAYEAGAKKLASQVADLNKVYGNMLNALG